MALLGVGVQLGLHLLDMEGWMWLGQSVFFQIPWCRVKRVAFNGCFCMLHIGQLASSKDVLSSRDSSWWGGLPWKGVLSAWELLCLSFCPAIWSSWWTADVSSWKRVASSHAFYTPSMSQPRTIKWTVWSFGIFFLLLLLTHCGYSRVFLEGGRMTYWPLTLYFVVLLQCDHRLLLLYCQNTWIISQDLVWFRLH